MFYLILIFLNDVKLIVDSENYEKRVFIYNCLFEFNLL